MQDTNPVSYTHLDVYKRQPYGAAGIVDVLNREAAELRLEYTDTGIKAEAVVTPELFGRVKPYIPGYAEPVEDWEK